MRMSLRQFAAVILAIAVVAGLAAPVRATVPSTLSYQGVLTDNGGNLVPNGPYNITFRIYSDTSGGSALWTETQSAVPVNSGGFSVVLGSVTPIDISFDRQLYMSIAINGGAELAPRVALTPAPQALALRLPYTGVTNTIENSLTVINQAPGQGAIYADPSLYVGGIQDGIVGVGSTAAPYSLLNLEAFPEGGFVTAWSSVLGSYASSMGYDTFTNAGALKLYKGPSTKVNMSGDWSGSGDPLISMTGSSRSITLNTADSGDASVSLPANAISSSEILDEPGIAQGHFSNRVDISSAATVTDLVSVQITTPAPGYIVVEADGMHGLRGDGTSQNEAEFTIKDAPGGAIDNTNYYVSGFANNAPNTFLFRTSVSMRRTYFRPAGTYTFYFQARANNPSSLSNYIWNPTITASYSPTSYGSVTTLVTSEEASREGLKGGAVSAASGPGGEHVPSDAVEVDLRTLELRAAKLREAAAEAEAAAMKARLAAEAAPRKVLLPKRVKP